MKISESWLREGVDLSGISRATLLEKLTAAGLEVESCEPVAAPFTGVCVAQIVACEKHPDAERLRVCSVDAGEAQPLSRVCGAANARTGLSLRTSPTWSKYCSMSRPEGRLCGNWLKIRKPWRSASLSLT